MLGHSEQWSEKQFDSWCGDGCIALPWQDHPYWEHAEAGCFLVFPSIQFLHSGVSPSVVTSLFSNKALLPWYFGTQYPVFFFFKALITGFPVSLVVKNPLANAGATGDGVSIPESGRSPGEGNGNPLHLLENSHGQRNLAGHSPWGHKELDMTEHTHHTHI